MAIGSAEDYEHVAHQAPPPYAPKNGYRRWMIVGLDLKGFRGRDRRR